MKNTAAPDEKTRKWSPRPQLLMRHPSCPLLSPPLPMGGGASKSLSKLKVIAVEAARAVSPERQQRTAAATATVNPWDDVRKDATLGIRTIQTSLQEARELALRERVRVEEEQQRERAAGAAVAAAADIVGFPGLGTPAQQAQHGGGSGGDGGGGGMLSAPWPREHAGAVEHAAAGEDQAAARDFRVLVAAPVHASPHHGSSAVGTRGVQRGDLVSGVVVLDARGGEWVRCVRYAQPDGWVSALHADGYTLQLGEDFHGARRRVRRRFRRAILASQALQSAQQSAARTRAMAEKAAAIAAARAWTRAVTLRPEPCHLQPCPACRGPLLTACVLIHAWVDVCGWRCLCRRRGGERARRSGGAELRDIVRGGAIAGQAAAGGGPMVRESRHGTAAERLGRHVYADGARYGLCAWPARRYQQANLSGN
jgi:hypothetical protein